MNVTHYDCRRISCSSETVRSRVRSSLELVFCGDALSMPVHWFYRPSDILRYFPPMGITAMEAAPAEHPSAIMTLHSTQRGGRQSVAKGNSEIVGDVILKGREHLWKQGGAHYHHGMPAGENTLNTWVARLMLEWMTDRCAYDVDGWLQQYVDFMIADPPRHPDTYAESCHREFFANREAGKPLRECGGVTHDTPSMGALVTLPPLALALLATQPLADVQAACREHVQTTHPDKGLLSVVDSYVALLANLLFRPEEETADDYIEAAAVTQLSGSISSILKKKNDPREIVGGVFSLACYISDSWPSVCYLAHRYASDPGKALLLNSNLGGENAHRGSVLGSLIGLVTPDQHESLFAQLHRKNEISEAIGQWVDFHYPADNR